MSNEMEQQKIQTTFQLKDVPLEQQTQSFEHQVLDPQNIQQEVERARLSEQVFQDVRSQMQGATLPVQQVRQAIRQPESQPQTPQAAPQEQSWKERRSKKKQQEKNLKRGKKLTAHADELTANLVERQQAWNENARAFRDFGYSRNDVSEELVETLTSMQDVKVTAEMFAGENFVHQYAFLRETMEKAAYIARIATHEPLMGQLRTQNFNLYSTALYWHQKEPMLRKMFRLANTAHGLNEQGEVLRNEELSVRSEKNGTEVLIPNIVHHTRNRFGAILDSFRSTMAEQEQAHHQTLLGELQGEFQTELVRQKTDAIMNSTEEERNWMEAPGLAYYGTRDAYETIQEIKGLIEGNSVYLAHKSLVDKMFSDIIRRFEVLGELKAQSNAWGELQYRYQNYQNQPRSAGAKLWREASGQGNRLMQDSIDVEDNLSNIKNALTHFLQGKPFNLLEAAVLETYGYHAAEDVAVSQGLDQLASCRARREIWQNNTLKNLLDRGDFKPANRESQYVTRAVTLFRQGDDTYNLQILNTLQQFEKELNRPRLQQPEEMSNQHYSQLLAEDTRQRQDYYNKILRMVEPAVKRIMAWDMDRFLQMDDQQLMQAQEELDALFGSNMFTADLMKLSHPEKKDCRMKDDLLGDRLDDFSHRIAILRALTDKSRGLALKTLGNLVPLTDAYFNTELTYGKLGDGSQAARQEYARKQIELGNRQLQNEQKRWADHRDIHSAAFQQACKEKYTRLGSQNRLPHRVSPLDEVAQLYMRNIFEVQPDATPEEYDILQRLKNGNYRLACWDKEDSADYAREHSDGTVVFQETDFETMGEPLFRTFSAYVQTPGARTQTPESFQQMLRDLSAGAELQRDVSSDREIFQAREQNMRGCLEFKESLRLSYEYLGKKYGYGLETLSPLEIYDHWTEILRDFGNIQVDMNFINRIPGIVDMNNQEDLVLYHQINYFSVFCQAVQSLLQLVGTGVPADEVITMIRSVATGSTAGPHRQVLQEHGDASGMAFVVTWGSAVQVGERRALPAEDLDAKESRWEEFHRKEEARREKKLSKQRVAKRQKRITQFKHAEIRSQDKILNKMNELYGPTPEDEVTLSDETVNQLSDELLKPYVEAAEAEVERDRALNAVNRAKESLQRAPESDREYREQKLEEEEQILRVAEVKYAAADPELEDPLQAQKRKEAEELGQTVMDAYRASKQKQAQASVETLEQSENIQKLAANPSRLGRAPRKQTPLRKKNPSGLAQSEDIS